MGLSKRQVALQFGFNQKLVETLITEDILRILPGCTHLRPKIDPDSLGLLREGVHYVVCQSRGAFQAQISTKHLRACSGETLEQYRERFPDARLISDIASQNKVKTPEQKVAQSVKLKARFRTAAGEVTRQQIAANAKKVMASGYREQAAEHLRVLGCDPDLRAARSLESRRRWANGDQREAVEGWHRKNRTLSLEMAAHARSHIQKTSRLHRHFKQSLVAAGVGGLITEYPIGFYSIDEAHPELKIAIEVDGCYWHGCSVCGFKGVGDIVQLDRRKNTYLTRRGWMVLRLSGHEIKSNLASCIARIVDALEQREAA